MRIAITYAEVTQPLFINSVNLGVKIGIGSGVKRAITGIQYDTKLNLLIIPFGKFVQIVPQAAIVQMTVADPADIDVDLGAVEPATPVAPTSTPTPNPHLPPAARAAMAQVSDPSRPAVGQTGVEVKPLNNPKPHKAQQ